MLIRIRFTSFIQVSLLSGCLLQLPGSLPPKPRLGDTHTRSIDGAVMVFIPEGTFLMGSDIEMVNMARNMCEQYKGSLGIGTCQQSQFMNEFPAHGVQLDGFWMDKTEVTNAQFRLCVQAGACAPPVEISSYHRESYYDSDRFDSYPVIWVRWEQAERYCDWAGGRLPTEAEWEYAARGPNNTVFPWGDEFDGTKLNYCDLNCDNGLADISFDDGFADTAPVGTYPSGESWCGALDMAGNVREWVADWFGYYEARDQKNPNGPINGQSRIPKGGSWLDTVDDVRSTNRGENSPDYSRHKVGFRCVSDL